MLKREPHNAEAVDVGIVEREIDNHGSCFTHREEPIAIHLLHHGGGVQLPCWHVDDKAARHVASIDGNERQVRELGGYVAVNTAQSTAEIFAIDRCNSALTV